MTKYKRTGSTLVNTIDKVYLRMYLFEADEQIWYQTTEEGFKILTDIKEIRQLEEDYRLHMKKEDVFE